MNPTLGWSLSSGAVWGDFFLKAATLLYMQKSVGLFKERVAGRGENAQVAPRCGISGRIQMSVLVSVSYLCDHGKSQDEEGDAADQGEERFVFPQVFGELV